MRGRPWARGASKVHWADLHAGFNEGDGTAGAAFLPRAGQRGFHPPRYLRSITLSSGSSKPEGNSWAGKACLGLALACLGGHCVSGVVLEGLRSCWYFCGWLTSSVICPQAQFGIKLGETSLHFSYYFLQKRRCLACKYVVAFLAQEERR